MPKNELRMLPLAQVRPNDVALRSVNKKSEKFIGLVDSVRQKGIINPIAVREAKDPTTNSKYFAVVDGLHRYTAAVEANLDAIPCHIMTGNEIDFLEMQIIGNIQKVETQPAQYSKQLHRLLALDPTMTVAGLAKRLGQSETWVNQRLNLANLTEDIKDLVDTDKINISNAVHLAKLPPEEQPNFVDRAMTMTPGQFIPTVTVRYNEIKNAKRQGRQASSVEFVPTPYLQKLSAIKQELNTKEFVRGAINQFGLTTPEQGFTLALQWVLHLDPISVQIEKEKDDKRKAELAAAREAKKKEKEALKSKEASLVRVGLENEDEDETEDEDEE